MNIYFHTDTDKDKECTSETNVFIFGPKFYLQDCLSYIINNCFFKNIL